MGGPPPGPPLDSAPPAPTPAGPGGVPLVAGQGAATAADPAAQAKQQLQQIVQLGTEVDRALLSLASVGQAGAEEFGQARQLIAAGLQKVAAAQGGGASGGTAPATSPTAPGNSFPGGGLGTSR